MPSKNHCLTFILDMWWMVTTKTIHFYLSHNTRRYKYIDLQADVVIMGRPHCMTNRQSLGKIDSRVKTTDQQNEM